MTDDDNSTIKLSYQAIGGKEIEFTKLVAVFVFCFSLSLSLSLCGVELLEATPGLTLCSGKFTACV
jgi:hypothetical protein